jgi:hypothetical protein
VRIGAEVVVSGAEKYRAAVAGVAGLEGGNNARPLRHNGQPYSGINILMLWASQSNANSRPDLDDL